MTTHFLSSLTSSSFPCHPEDYVEADVGTTPTLKFDVISDPPLVGDIRHTLSRDAEPAPRRFNDDGEVGTASFYLDVTTPLPPTSENVYPCNPFIDFIYDYTLL